MSNKYQTYVPQAFNLTTLNERIAKAQAVHSKHYCLYEPQTMFFRSYDQYVKDGYVRDEHQPVLAMPSGSETWIQVHLIKPKRVITKELEQLAVEVEELYKAEVKASQAEALARMTQRLLAEQEVKEAKEAAARRASLEADAAKEAAAILGLEV